jgi:hypothetical protein
VIVGLLHACECMPHTSTHVAPLVNTAFRRGRLPCNVPGPRRNEEMMSLCPTWAARRVTRYKENQIT